MKRLWLVLPAIAWLALGLFSSSVVHAQAQINCAPSTPCNSSTGPSNTGTGDQAWKAFGVVNANFSLLPSQLFSGAALPVNKGGTGALTLTGPLKGNGTGAISPALAADIYALWSGTCSSSTFLRGDGSCQTPAGGGNVSNSGTPTNHQTGVWTSATTIQGVGPGTNGQAFASTGATTDPAFTSSLSGVTSVNGSTVPSSTTLAGLGIAETWTALQTFTNSDFALLGSSTGTTTFSSANAGASNFTLTFPALTDTLVTLTATQTLTNKSIAGSEINSGTVGTGFGGTGATSLAGANIPVQSGAITSGHCVQWATATSITDSGATCGAGGSSAFSALTSSTNTTAAMVVGTGASLATTGTGSISANQINGTALSGLSTGLLKNTTSTGVPSIATSADVIADWSGTCSSSTYLRGDGSCATPGGAGTVTTTGTPATGNLTKFSGSTSITNGDLSGDVTTSGTLATTVVKVNGGSVPASAAVLASNSSSQLTALTLGANLAISSGVLGTTQAINAQTGTTYAMLSGDAGKLVTFNNASAVAVSLSQATTAGFTAGYSFDVQNLGAGLVTITPATSTVNGASTLTIPTNNGCTITSDGTNYQVSACTAVDTDTFAQITSGTNTTAAMLVGTGASLGPTGTGTISANQVNGATVPASASVLTSNGSSQLVASVYTLTGTSGKTLNFTNSLTLSGTDSTTFTFPGTTGTVDTLNSAQTFTAAKTFTNSDLLLLGSSTGATTFTSANSGASNFTITVPAATDTLVTLAATQTLTNKSIAASEVNSGTLAAAQMPALTGDVTSTSGTVATTVVKVNGGSVPASAGMVTTNSSSQIVAEAIVTDATPGAGPTNDYSPSGFGPTTGVLYITPTSGGSTFNGMAAQNNLQHVYLVNAEAAGGADNLKLVNQSASDTTAANRFLTSATSSLAIPPGGRVLCIYLAGSINRWQCQ